MLDVRKYLYDQKVRFWIFDHLTPLVQHRRYKVGSVRLFLNPHDAVVSRKMFARGWWEPLESEKIEQAVTTGSACIDIGAHVGFYACLMAKRVGPEGAVYALEASHDNYIYLKKNAAENPNIIAEQYAVCDTCGNLDLHLSAKHRGDHRLYQPVGESERLVENVSAITLVEYFNQRKIEPENVSVIKIDTQGAEPRILLSSQSLFSKLSKTTWFTEFWPSAYEEQGHGLGAQYLRMLDTYFDVWELNYVLNTFARVSSLTELEKLYVDLLEQVRGVDHSTLVLKNKKQ